MIDLWRFLGCCQPGTEHGCWELSVDARATWLLRYRGRSYAMVNGGRSHVMRSPQTPTMCTWCLSILHAYDSAA